MNNSTALWIVIGVIVLGGIGWYAWSASHKAATPVEEQTETTPAATTTAANPAPQAPTGVTVTYSDSGFSPKSVTIAEGETVTWVNKSSESMWVASNPHPTHQGYDGTTGAVHCAAGYTGPAPFDECSSNGTFTFTFGKTGTWGYHNHADHGMTGAVIVTAPPVGVSASTTLNVQ